MSLFGSKGGEDITLQLNDTYEDRSYRKKLLQNGDNVNDVLLPMNNISFPSAPLIYNKSQVSNIYKVKDSSSFDSSPTNPKDMVEYDNDTHPGKYKPITVSESSDEVKATFRFWHYCSLAFVMLCAYLPPILIIEYSFIDLNATLLTDHLWLSSFLLLLIIVIFIISYFDYFQHFSHNSQIIILLSTMIVLVVSLTMLSILFDTLTLAKGGVLSSFYMLGFACYTWQSRYDMTKTGSLLFIVLSMALVSFGVLFFPYQDMWKRLDIEELSKPPPTLWSSALTLGFAFLILCMFVFRSSSIEKRVSPDEYLYATFLTFTDGFVLLMFVGKDFCCQKICLSNPVNTSNSLTSLHNISKLKDII